MPAPPVLDPRPSASVVLRRLGCAPDERLIIFHVDDVGMCEASVRAFGDLWAAGAVSSGAGVVPCPWFPAVAELCRTHPDVDMGVHATLNAEWAHYRWRPVSTLDPATGLVDEEGYLHRRQPAVLSRATPDAVQAEIRAQMDRALAAGIDVTHLDAHMLTAVFPRFAPGYLAEAARARVPAMFPSPALAARLEQTFGPAVAVETGSMAARLAGEGYPVVDAFDAMPLNEPRAQLDYAKYRLRQTGPGLTHFVLHPAVDTPELRAICHDWACRVANYRAFLSPDLRQFITDEGFRIVGYRALRDLVRTPLASPSEPSCP